MISTDYNCFNLKADLDLFVVLREMKQMVLVKLGCYTAIGGKTYVARRTTY